MAFSLGLSWRRQVMMTVKSDAAPQRSDSTDEHRLKVTAETWVVNLIRAGTETVFPSKLAVSEQTF